MTRNLTPTTFIVAAAFLVGVAAALLLASGAHAGTAPSCPNPGLPPMTPPAGAPAAPSDGDLLGGVLTWTDNSDNEDGFLVCVDPGGFEFVVGPDTTSFTPPPDVPPNCPSVFPGDESATFFVYAFNAQGIAGGILATLIVDCGSEVPTATPTTAAAAATATPPAALPDTGAGSGDGGPGMMLWALLAGGALALLGLGTIGLRRSRASL